VTLNLLTLFPEIAGAYFRDSIMARAVERGLIAVNLVNIRDFSTDRHRTVDDAPYGGGAGMVLMVEPLSRALESIGTGKHRRTVYPTPSGRRFTAEYARSLSVEPELTFICGRYEGIDQRVVDRYVDDEICIGDYVLSSGEIAALTIIDSMYRFLPGVIREASLAEESFTEGLLEYPQYTRPEEFEGLRVPEVLLSGHHEKIREWRLRQSIEKTRRNRPDLIESQTGSRIDVRDVLGKTEEE